MSRVAKILLVLVVVLMLSCNLITQPISEVQNLAGTAQYMGSQAPALQTMIANPSMISPDALASAMPSGMPGLPSLPNIPGMPDVSACTDVSGSPVATWNEVPVMPDATAGKEASSGLYCFTTPSSVTDAKKFYQDKLVTLGWTASFASPDLGNQSVLIYQNTDHVLNIVIIVNGQATLVVLSLR